MAAVPASDREIQELRHAELQKKDWVVGKYVCFTSYDVDTEPQWCPEKMSYLIFQKEIAPSTGRLHWQGYVEFKTTSRLYAIWKALDKKGAFVAKRKAKNGKAAADYCRKPDTAVKNTQKEYGEITGAGKGHRTDLDTPINIIREGGSLREVAKSSPEALVKYHKGFSVLKELLEDEIKVPMPKIVLREWQKQLIHAIDTMDEIVDRRKGFWIWSKASSTGKTTTMKYIQWKYGLDNVAIGDFRWDDFVYAYKRQKVIVFNLPRDQEMNATQYSVLEKATDGGVVLSRKYESRNKYINAIVIVFANQPPPHTRLPDRFIEINLDPERPTDILDEQPKSPFIEPKEHKNAHEHTCDRSCPPDHEIHSH